MALAYTPDTRWRNRAEFCTTLDEARAFLQRKWAKELEYRLIKELFLVDASRIAVRYAYEWRDDSGNWFRCAPPPNASLSALVTWAWADHAQSDTRQRMLPGKVWPCAPL